MAGKKRWRPTEKWARPQIWRQILRKWSPRTKKVAAGLKANCRATRRAKGTDLRNLWILEEVGCHLQKGVPWCSIGTPQKKRLQENSDPGKLWTMKGIGCSQQDDNPQYKSGTVQGTQLQEIQPGWCGTRNPERIDVWEEMLEGPKMQQWHKGQRPKTAATRQKANKDPRHKTAAAP
jgi:hypothetical protein